MRRFHCQSCSQQVFFENDQCGACASPLGFDALALTMTTLTFGGDAYLAAPDQRPVRRCGNYQNCGCNWLIRAGDSEPFCRACRHNRTIPDLSVPRNLDLWREFEGAKRRLFYALLSLGLPLRTRAEDSEHGLAFDCIDDQTLSNGDTKRAMTGHDNGIITIALKEADPAQREGARVNLGESYRTLLGHLRHEIGHYYWDLLVLTRPQFLEQSRALFGDERQDYGQALKRHYENGAAPDWQNTYITAYASSHPWEDFAETWQHYLHIVDTLETSRAFDVAVDSEFEEGRARAPFDPYHAADVETLVKAWTPLTIAMNCLNRSMGLPDLYPFVMPAPAIEKLGFIRDVIARCDEKPRLEQTRTKMRKPLFRRVRDWFSGSRAA